MWHRRKPQLEKAELSKSTLLILTILSYSSFNCVCVYEWVDGCTRAPSDSDQCNEIRCLKCGISRFLCVKKKWKRKQIQKKKFPFLFSIYNLAHTNIIITLSMRSVCVCVYHPLVLIANKQGEADDHKFTFTQEAMHSYTRKKHLLEKHTIQ